MRTIIGIIGMVFFFISGCTTVILVNAPWENNKITIDGDEKDWADRSFYLNQQNILLGIRNDADYLYFFMKSVDRQQIRDIRRGGLTIWLDPSGGDGKKYGIKIPPSQAQWNASDSPDASLMQSDIFDLEIYSEGKKDPVRIPVAELKGIQFTASHSQDRFIIECKVPLHATVESPLQWNVTGSVIGMTLETGKVDRPKKESVMPEIGASSGDNGGEMPRGGMGRGGGRGEGRQRGESGDFKQSEKKGPLEFWFKVRLSDKK